MLLLPPDHVGVSSYEAKRSKAGKQSPEPGAGSSQTPPTAADAPSKGGKCASAARKPRSKKQRIICIVIPLVILAILGGIGAAIGITMSQQKGAVASKGKAAPAPATRAAAPGAAPAVSQPLSFKVNVTLPPDESGAPAPSCSELFSPQADRGKLEVRHFSEVELGKGWLYTLVSQYRTLTGSVVAFAAMF